MKKKIKLELWMHLRHMNIWILQAMKVKKIKSTNLITENKMIFTCGNSISIEVLEALFEEMIKIL